MRQHSGIGVSPGIVVGRVFVLDDIGRRIPKRRVPAEAVDKQLGRLARAVEASLADLEQVRTAAEQRMGAEAAKIFGFHIGMLRDDNLLRPMREMIQAERVTAEHAADRVLQQWADRFNQMGDSAFTTKVNDITDLAHRLTDQLVGEHTDSLRELDREAIVVARELTPSQTVAFDRERVVALATDLGGSTSHTAIVARALGIPAVVGLKDLSAALEDGTTVIIDGLKGVVVVEPDDDTIDSYLSDRRHRESVQLSLRESAALDPITSDGTRIEVLGNIEFPDETAHVLEFGGSGVGLYRTEFLYLSQQTEPSEDQQYAAYSDCVRQLGGMPLTIRTMDLGADKYTRHQEADPERNPALGLRSIRYCLQHLPMFKRQLRAVLRASAIGPVKVMFPLVTNITELREARHILNDVMEDLDEAQVPFDRQIEVGIMIEVPAAALQAPALAKEVDFFSIGTNDLVQYTLAVDRTNERVAGLFNPGHPAVLKLIRDVVRAGRRRAIPISCCGEAAAQSEFAVLLLGLGVRTLSVSPGSVPYVKQLIRSVSVERCEKIAKKAISFDSDSEVTMYVRDQLRKLLPDADDFLGLRR
ncbi:MAG: phosphoenolpyruvate--protein phosphotransferase [Planctomycetota bacterium]